MIRCIREEDAERIRDIAEKQLGHASSADLIRQRIEELSGNDAYHIAVYEDDESHRVEGFLQAERYNLLYGENGWNVIALAVDAPMQKKGIGRQLLSSLEARAAEDGYTFVRLNCNTVRKEAHEFYRHMGYRCDKTQSRFIRNLK